MNPHKGRRIWIDLDNSPHVPFFVPIVKELEQRGHSVFVTTRECFQVTGLADYYGLNYKKVGKHYGANKMLKVLGTIWRSLQLAPTILKEKPDVSLSHGSRALILLSSLLRCPTVVLFDYEFARMLPFVKPEMAIAPDVIRDPELARHFKRGVRPYQGLKEDVYVSSFKPDRSILRTLNLGENDLVATIRPPASEAHYHNRESDILFTAVVDFLGTNTETRMVILPRNETKQRDMVFETWPRWCREGRIIVPDQVLDGLNLIWHSDFVVSGGGTMNREAAAFGVPVYSIFRGPIGAVDRYLAEQGRLVLIKTPEDVRSKIRAIRRPKPKEATFGERIALKEVIAAIEEVTDTPTLPDPRSAAVRTDTRSSSTGGVGKGAPSC